eukprot:gene25247-biopygen2237
MSRRGCSRPESSWNRSCRSRVSSFNNADPAQYEHQRYSPRRIIFVYDWLPLESQCARGALNPFCCGKAAPRWTQCSPAHCGPSP